MFGRTKYFGHFSVLIMYFMKEKNTESYSHVLKYTGVFGGVQGLNILASLVRNKLTAVLLGPNGMGLASLLGTTLNFVSQATNFGISFSGVKHVSQIFDSGDEAAVEHFVKVIRVWSLLTALLGMAVCIIISPFLNSSSFTWGNHTLHFLMLAPAVGLFAITGGETAILKGARRLRSLAVIQIYSALLAVVISVPLYYCFNQTGIVPVIVLTALSSMLLTIRYSYRLYPLRLSGARSVFGEGLEMVKLGTAFVLAGVLGSGSEMLVRSYLNVVTGDLDFVGLYNAGFMLTVTYAGVVFSAMEADYFPRLSAVPDGDVSTLNQTVNRQIEVSLLLISPMLAGFIVTLPLLIPLLFSANFTPIVSMAQVAVFAMYLKSLSLPISYTNLAKSNSLGYLLLEFVYYAAFIVTLMWGFSRWGLFGTGVALVLSYVVELVTVTLYTHRHYGYVLSSAVVRYSLLQFAIGALAYSTTFVESAGLRWTLGFLAVITSLGFSLAILRKKTSLWNALTKKYLRKRA